MTYHQGELAVQAQVGVQEMASRIGRGIRNFIPPIAKEFLLSRTIAIASSVDENGQVWASLLSDMPGFLLPVDDNRVQVKLDNLLDDILFANLPSQPEIGMIVIDFSTRQRMRLNGTVELHPEGFLITTSQVYSNCPKYIHVRNPQFASREVDFVEHRQHLTEYDYGWLESSDTFFIASYYHEGGADASHRGGEPGFVRILNDKTLEFPDYSGNTMFNTLGNIAMNPYAGLLFIDFDTGSTFQLSGKASIVHDVERVSRFSGAERVIEYRVDTIIETRTAL